MPSVDDEIRELLEDDSWEGNPYLEECHDAELRRLRREQAALDEAEFEDLCR